MNKYFVSMLGFIALVVVVLGLSWMFTGNDFFLYRYFAPKQESVRREVFKNSQAYNDGMVQDLQNLRLQYTLSHDPEARAALSSTILQRSSVYPEDRLPVDLKAFIDGLRTGVAQ